jgi:hypothetical protein
MQLVWEFLETIWITYKFSSWHHRITTHDTRLVLHWTPSSTKCFTFHWLPQRTPQLPFVAFENLCWNWKHVVFQWLAFFGPFLCVQERSVLHLGVVTLVYSTSVFWRLKSLGCGQRQETKFGCKVVTSGNGRYTQCFNVLNWTQVSLVIGMFTPKPPFTWVLNKLYKLKESMEQRNKL